MRTTVLHCKTIAPMFMAGQSINIPELRAPSIKGVMRYIWRATQCCNDINAMRTNEGLLFGQARDKDHTNDSQMRLQILTCNNDIIGESPLLPHRIDSNYSGENRGNVRKTKTVKEGTEFDVIIRSNESRTDSEVHENFLRLFFITIMLMGFGRRARKGMGSIKIIKIDGFGNSMQYGWDSMVENLKKISGHEWINDDDTIRPSYLNKSAKYPYVCSIQRIKSTHSTQDLIKKIGLTLHECKKDTTRSYEFLGKSSSGRFASSLLLSTSTDVNDSYCIVTRLNCTLRIDDHEKYSDGLKNFNYELKARI